MHFSCQLDALEFTIPITLWHNYVNFHFIALPTRTQVYKYRRKRHGNGKVAKMVGRHQLLWLAPRPPGNEAKYSTKSHISSEH